MAALLGEILTNWQILTTAQLESALRRQKVRQGRIGSILIELGYVDHQDIATALEEQHAVPCVDLLDFPSINPALVELIPLETAIRHQVLPLRKTGAVLTVAITDPTNVPALDEVRFMTGLQVEPVVAPELCLRQATEEYYGTEATIALQEVCDELATQGYQLDFSEDEEHVDLGELQKSSSQAPVIKLVNLILAEAIRQGASDVHVEPYEKEFRVRHRIDGVLRTMMNPPVKLRDALISRIKIMASLDISQRRLPQEGRFKMQMTEQSRQRHIDFRVSVVPTLFGEKVVLRILDPTKLRPNLEQLGLESTSLKRLKRSIHAPHGVVLATGPTGSGKTSTLYTCLHQLNTSEVNILTAEDPVEFHFVGVNQVQTNEELGLTFATALRSFLRQDPNIVMLGEIRDSETAEVAVKAALTGHLVLSTLHTIDAPTAIDRLVNMGVERFLVATSVRLICAQRLVRKICSDCKEKVQFSRDTLIQTGFSPAELTRLLTYQGRGCPTCHNSGYKGRTGLFEVLEISADIRQMILNGDHVEDIRHQARNRGMITLRESGLEKIRAGITTVEEVVKETLIH